VDEQVVRFTVSIGIACLRQDDVGIEAVLRRADEALYLAKNGGRNRVISVG
jgi:diguanylate cyclase (GGDEF)-like protein